MKKLLMILVFVLTVGCASTKNPVIPVKGKIVYEDGQTLPAGTKVNLSSVEGGVGSASGETNASGEFSLKHHKGISGAETGKYILVLRAPNDDDKNFYKTIPKLYYEEGLSVEVKKGMDSIEVKVKRK